MLFVGVDAHKATSQVTVVDSGGQILGRSGRSGGDRGQLPILIRSQIGQLQGISLVRIFYLSLAIRRPGRPLRR